MSHDVILVAVIIHVRLQSEISSSKKDFYSQKSQVDKAKPCVSLTAIFFLKNILFFAVERGTRARRPRGTGRARGGGRGAIPLVQLDDEPAQVVRIAIDQGTYNKPHVQ